MSTALIQLTQGVTVGAAGEALFGAAGAAVDVANAVNTGVTSWQIELVDVPPGSALTTGTKASSDNGSTPAYSFTPDVAGGYRLVLKVWDGINRVGTATDTDIRNFGVKGAGGLYLPTQQIWPRPLPPVASGEAGAKPDENNFAGQTRGWAGTGSDGMIATLIRRLDAEAARLATQGLVAQTYDRVSNVNSTASGAVSGTLQGVLVNLSGEQLTNLHVIVATLPTALTLAKLSVYTLGGVLLAQTASAHASFTTQGLKTAPLITPYTPTPGPHYFALLQVATTPAGCNHGAGNIFGNEAVGSGRVPMPVMTGQVDLPSPAVWTAPTGIAPSIGRGLWIGAS